MRYVVRYGAMRFLGEFSTKGPAQYARSAQVIVRSHRGTEWGEILCPATDRTAEYLGAKDAKGKILRDVTPDDDRQRDEIWQRERESFEGCMLPSCPNKACASCGVRCATVHAACLAASAVQ